MSHNAYIPTGGGGGGGGGGFTQKKYPQFLFFAHASTLTTGLMCVKNSTHRLVQLIWSR